MTGNENKIGSRGGVKMSGWSPLAGWRFGRICKNSKHGKREPNPAEKAYKVLAKPDDDGQSPVPGALTLIKGGVLVG